MSDWIKHDGGPCPVDPETMVLVRTVAGPAYPVRRADLVGGWRYVTEFQIVDPTPSAPPVLMARDDGGPAFPVADLGVHGHYGMSLLDWYAGQVAAGMAAFSGTAGISYGPEEIAGRSHQVAAALVAARSRALAARNEGER